MNKIRPRLTEEEYQVVQNYRKGIENTASDLDLNLKDVKHGWLKSKQASVFFKNPDYEKPDFDLDSIDWESIVKVPKITRNLHTKARHGIFDRAVYTDVHIGMNPNPDGYSLYGGKWDEHELEERRKKFVNHILLNQKSNHLIIDDLADLADGYDKKTVRREHELPQNMDNQKIFDEAVKFKYQIYIDLINYYDTILFNNITESNHGGSFDYIINSAFKAMVEASGISGVEVVNHRKFISHYQVKDNVFIITHGKDSKNLKFGFKPQLDKAQMEKIDNYIDEHFLLQPNVKIEFSKGDSHQMLFDWSTSDRFNYHNYPAFSPSSNWVQTNYKKGKSGFVVFNYYGTDEFDIKPYFFKWKQ